MEKDWDNLIILDACRHDLYEEMKGEKIEKRVTLGSTSKEFIEENFGDSHDDIVQITANGFVADEFLEGIVGVKNPFFEKYETIRTDWDDELGATRPESVYRDAVSAEKLFPEKRKIIHFIQPHSPYIGFDFNYNREESRLEVGVDNSPEDEEKSLDKAEKGKIKRSEIMEAYRQNLSIVYEYVEKLNKQLDGKTVVTADHGELLGEKGLYGHPGGKDAKVLREVP